MDYRHPLAAHVRVLIADDHPLIIEGLTLVLGRYGIDVVGHATRTDDVLPGFGKHKPDVLVLDVRFAESATGLDVARQILRSHSSARIVFYSQFDQDEIVREAYRIGGVGFITKNAPPEVLAQAIQHAHAGQVYFAPDIAQRLALIGVRGDDSPQSKLDGRELQVFKLMAQGRTNVEIAELMSLSPKTISSTSQNIKDKLGVSRPADITLLAVRHKVIVA